MPDSRDRHFACPTVSGTRRKRLLALMLLCLAVIVLTVPVRDVSAQKEQSGSDTGSSKVRDNASVSAVDCLKVSYGESDKTEDDSESDKTDKDPNPEGATRVGVDLYVDKITEIDSISNTFNIEGIMDLVWCDPRQEDKAGWYLEEEVNGVLTNTKRDNIWWPDIILVNQEEGRETQNRVLIIRPNGTIHYRERFAARLGKHYNFRKFPFDHQTLKIEIESFEWDAKEVKLLNENHDYDPGPEHVRLSNRDNDYDKRKSRGFDIPEWGVECGWPTKYEGDDKCVKDFVIEEKEDRDKEEFSEFIAKIDVQRHGGFHFWKMMVPLISIVMISWSVFWMTGESLSSRMGIALTVILTVVAYQFVTSRFLPDVEYFTFWDGILMFSLVLMALTVVENVLIHTLRSQDEEKFAARIDWTCRWLFPLVYAIGIGLWAAIVFLINFRFWIGVLTLSLALMALTVAENIAVHSLRSQDREKLATRIDRICLWVLPLVYVIGMVLLIVLWTPGGGGTDPNSAPAAAAPPTEQGYHEPMWWEIDQLGNGMEQGYVFRVPQNAAAVDEFRSRCP